jgi:thiamine kinase-like enzyme
MVDTFDLPSLERQLDEIPALASKPRTVEQLSGGLTNINLKVSTPGGVFVARCFRGDTELLGIDRDAEHRNTEAAAASGAGPAVIDYRPDLGVLVIGFIDGVTYDNDSFAKPGVVARAAAACRTLHSGPRFVNDFDMFSRQRRYLGIVHENGFALPAGYERYDERFQMIRAALAAHDQPTVPCNNDLLAGNFVDDGTKVWLIDYEYSGNNDPCFELGNISTECDLQPEQVDELATSYFGAPLRSRIARVRLQAMVSQYGWSLWGAIQAGASPLDFDFESWGMERFEKAARGLTSEGFSRLLDEVGRDD